MEIGGFVKNSFVDYPQKITCVVFTIGCNMNCWYCHNKHLLSEEAKNKVDEKEIFNFLQTHKTFLDAVTISGGEPTLQKDLPNFIKKIKSLGYLIKLDTNGTNYEMLKALIDDNLLNYVAMDIKAPLDNYNLVTSSYNITRIKKSVALLKQNKVNYEFRTTISPNLTLKDIEKIAKDINGAETYCLQQYKKPEHIVNTGKELINLKQCNVLNFEPVSENFVLQCREIASKYVKKVLVKGL